MSTNRSAKGATPEIIEHAGSILSRYDVLFSDVWGVVHDGRKAFPGANDALTRFRAGGGTVVLVSNAPMPADEVARVLDEKRVVRSAWDAIVSSGDIALRHIAEKGYKRLHRIFRQGFDEVFVSHLPGVDTPLPEAEAIVCTGPFDERKEEPEMYRERLIEPARRGVPFVCANPDYVVHVGSALIPCAGAIARIYEDLGGPVYWGGKPHPAAYATAFKEAERLRGRDVAKDRVLAIGDAVRTDLVSAVEAGVDALFVAGGIHRDDVIVNGCIDPARLEALFSGDAPPAIAATTGLIW